MENIVSINGTDIKPIEQVKPPRQIGFEILRIIAMFLISCIHVNEYGGIIEAANFPLDLKFLQAIYVVAVNVFVLISGYFLVSSKISYKKILKLWLQVLFYSLITFLVAAFVFSEVTNKRFGFWGILKSCMPVTFRQFWFFSAYFILYLTAPFLNKILRNSTKKELTSLVIGILILNYIVTRYFGIEEVFTVGSGYTVLWFIELYIIAGYLRLNPPRIKKRYYLIIYLFSTLLLFMFMCLPNYANTLYMLVSCKNTYNSYLVVFASISLFMLFSNITSKSVKLNKVVGFISSCTFGIYLFQESAIKPVIYFKILKVQRVYGSQFSFLYVFLFALCLFTIGILCEVIRKGIVRIISKIHHKKVTHGRGNLN